MSRQARMPAVNLAALLLAPLLALQWPLLHLFFPRLPVPWEPLLPGIAIFASAYLLSWAAEVAEVDVPPALALVLLSLVAVAPEYAVDIYFAWQGGKDPVYVPYAIANMTGGNRLLIGWGWAMVVLVYGWKHRKKEVKLEPRLRLETAVLLAATLYSFFIVFKKTLTWTDTAVFIFLFGFYFRGTLGGEVSAPAVEGPVAVVQRLSKTKRRFFVLGFFSLSAWTIYSASQPFAEGLLSLGRHWGIEEFILVQWLAPLASESPEFIVAALFALKARPTSSFNTILSSTVNQWTLLVGMLPLAYCLSSGVLRPMALDARQCEEVFLTAAQSLFGVVVLSNLRFSVREALILFVLFTVQALYPFLEPWTSWPSVYVRTAFAWVYLGLSLSVVVYSQSVRASFRALLGEWIKGFRGGRKERPISR